MAYLSYIFYLSQWKSKEQRGIDMFFRLDKIKKRLKQENINDAEVNDFHNVNHSNNFM